MDLFDSHIHTLPFSPDGHQYIEEVLDKARESEYGFIITEHMDYGLEGSMKFEFEPDEYFAKYGPYRNDRFLLGVEMGLMESETAKITKVVNENPFDMVIGSIHVVDGYDIALPGYSTTLNKREAYSKYFDCMYANIRKYSDFDTLAHIEYVCRYAKYDDPEIYVAEYKEALTSIFNFLIENDKCLELNTRRLDKEVGFNTLRELARLYAHCGGRYVTTGSDAHYAKNIAINFDRVKEIIKEFDLIPVYYKNRKRME